ncbi:kinesin-like protein KIF14 isoform X1 [Montipora capricornis]|uniref:kinesin-like protein KIF14 isoform X1 n=1 Tax=Montipora capricornis TaxID=246305 RepID=UPI0035F1D3CA
MTTPTKGRSKRALPSVPIQRAASTDRIDTGTPKSRSLSKKLDFENSSVDAIRNRKCSSNRPQQPKSVPGTDTTLRSKLSSRRKDPSSSESGSNASTPCDSPKETRKAAVAPTVAKMVDKFSSGSKETISLGRIDTKEDQVNTEKKIARVLPMTPWFLEAHISQPENEQELISKNDGELIDLKITELKSTMGDDNNQIETKGTLTPSGNKNIFDGLQSKLAGTPSFTKTTPQQPLVDDAEGSSIRVGVRVRPLLPREENDPNVRHCISMKDNKTIITSDSGMEFEFVYDYSIWSCDPKHPDFVNQEKLYELMGQPLLNSAFQGYNTCLFAYGQTGSGKSYSVMGQGDDRGILPRFCEELFERIKCWKELQFTVEISYFEIYNEKIHDLLAPSKKKDNKRVQLRVREHPILGPFVQDLSTYTASSYADVESWLAVGNSIRATAATGMNDKSSRSHSVFTLVMTQTKTEIFEDSETQMTTTSKINLIDLAGSERASQVLNDQVIKTAEVAALRLKEGGSINKSLHTLGKVISLLSDRETSAKKKMYIPYRDSTLTWLLKDSLGGNSKTTMIANISPASTSFGESLSTLRYAQRARTIVNRAVINEDPNAKIIRELKEEIERLKLYQGEGNQEISAKALAEVALLREKLKDTQRMLAESTRNWQEKLALTERRKLEEAEKLKKAGISFKVDNRLPNLVNLNEDPQLSEMLLYMLKEGETTVGQNDHDIKLNGALVAETHCVLRNDGEKVTVSPIGDAPTYVNGQLIVEETVLHHSDRVVIGGDHFFRLNHPIEVKKRKKVSVSNSTESGSSTERGVAAETASTVVKDYEFARNELAQAQDARLRVELEEAREEARIKAQEEIVVRIQEAKEAAQQELTMQKQEFEEKVSHLHEVMESLTTEKKQAEESKQTAVEKVSELQAHRVLLEQEILNNRKRLQMEALAAKQALEETKMNQVRIISELEKEKKKMQGDVLKLKEAKQNREKVREEFRASFNNIGRKNSLADDPNKRELLRITMSLREANKISQSLAKHVTFSRDDVIVDGKSEIKIRLNNTRKGLTTLWSLEKFESAMEQMRELYQQRDNDSVSGESGDETDPFNDPDDKWEKDFKLDSPSSRRISSLSSSGLTSRPRSSSVGKAQGISTNKAESIFAKYRNQQNGPSSDTTDEPTDNTGAFPTKPVEVTSSRSHVALSRQKSETGPPIISLPNLCREYLNSSVVPLKELSDPFREPLYEKILRTVKSIKSCVTIIKKEHEEKRASVVGSQNEVHRCCLTTTISLQLLMEHVRIWGATENGNAHLTQLSGQLIGTVTRLSDHFIKIIQTVQASNSVSNIDDLFSAFGDDVRQVVRDTAKIAVISQDELSTDGDESDECDDELNRAFVEGQDISMESSVRDSVSAILEIQEQLQTDTMDSYSTGVEREVSDSACKLVRATGDFIHQGREVQMQLISTSNENNRIKDKRRSRLMSVKKFVSSVNTFLGKVRDLASNMRTACEDMDIESLVSLPEEISSAALTIVRQKRAFIETQYSPSLGNNRNIVDEMEYLEKKCSDVELAAGDMRRTLQKFLFLSPPKSLQKKHTCKVLRTGDEYWHGEDSCPLIGRSREHRTPLSRLGKEREARSARRLWSKESPV